MEPAGSGPRSVTRARDEQQYAQEKRDQIEQRLPEVVTDLKSADFRPHRPGPHKIPSHVS